jgi:hypothetical protein
VVCQRNSGAPLKHVVIRRRRCAGRHAVEVQLGSASPSTSLARR